MPPAAPHVTPAGENDTIAGVPARFVSAPDSTPAVSAALRAAADDGLAVVARGAGTKQDWAAPPRALDLILDTGRLTGLVEHVAGDLVVVVRAGTPLSTLNAALAPAGQQLALDASPGATVGGVVATGESGPRRLRYGTARDLLIGITVVRADGVAARAGGKVVKNVAGYDLAKLYTGSYGTLGVITECAFRLHPLPDSVAWVSRRVDDPAEAGRLAAAVLGAQVVPSGLEIDAPAGGGYEVAVLLEGSPEGVRARAAATAALLGSGSEVRMRGGAGGSGKSGVAPGDGAADALAVGAQAAGSGAADASPAAGFGAADARAAGPPGVPDVLGRAEAASGRAEITETAAVAAPSAKVAGSAGPAWWAAYPWAPGDVGIKLTAALSGVPALLTAARNARDRHGAAVALRGSAGVGVLYASLPGGTTPTTAAAVVDDLRAAAHEAGGHAIVLTAAAAVRDAVDPWGPVPGLDLMRRVKERFDPGARLAPGRFVGGI